jgi:hypothetical protein
VQTRTRRALAALALVGALGGGIAWFATRRSAADVTPRALDAIPAGALLVATADLKALRASPLGAPFLREGREIQGLGKVKDVCGFDPMDSIEEVAVAIPAAGEGGDFGLAAAGPIQDEALLACASKVIAARGGRPVVTPIGSFSTVHDAALDAPGGEIAVRRGGPVLLGGGAYLRAMIDAADGRTPSIRSSVAHSRLAAEVGGGAARITVVLTPEQRVQLADELALSGAGDSPAASILAGALGVDLGPTVAIHGVVACAGAAACVDLGARLKAARDARVEDYGTRLMGFSAVLERVRLEPEGELLHVRLEVSAEEAGPLIERLIVLRGGLSHPDVGVGSPGEPGSAPPPTPKPPWLSPGEGLDSPRDAGPPVAPSAPVAPVAPPEREVVAPPRSAPRQ